MTVQCPDFLSSITRQAPIPHPCSILQQVMLKRVTDLEFPTIQLYVTLVLVKKKNLQLIKNFLTTIVSLYFVMNYFRLALDVKRTHHCLKQPICITPFPCETFVPVGNRRNV